MVISFQSDVALESHRCDKSTEWASMVVDAAPLDATYIFGCEPYLLHSRSNAPVYDERFVGYGKNRVAFHYELAAARRHRMRVVPDLFVYHLPHEGYAEAHSTKIAASNVTLMRQQRKRMQRYNWMVGESCWMVFSRDITKKYKCACALLPNLYSTCMHASGWQLNLMCGSPRAASSCRALCRT
eukprot:5995676-Prymnesium_polylepis.2